MVLCSWRMPRCILNVWFDSAVIPQVECHRHPRLVFPELLSWSAHTDHVSGNISAQLDLLRCVQHCASQLAVQDLYLYCVRPVMEYASVVLSELSSLDAARLER